MNKISRLGTYVLGAALGSGCVSTFNQTDLYDMIASDKKIDASDYRAFVSAEKALTERITSLEGEDKTRSEAMLADVRKVINKYENQANVSAKIKLQPVFDVIFPNAEERNLNGDKDSGAYLELTLDDLAKKVGNLTDALNILRKATPTWESTYGKRSNAERMIYRTSVENLRKWFGGYSLFGDPVVEIMTNLSPDNKYSVVPGTAGVRAIVNYGVDVTDADLESLTNLKPVEPAQPAEEQPENKEEQPAKKKGN